MNVAFQVKDNFIGIIGWNYFAKMLVDHLLIVNRKVLVITDKKDHFEVVNDNYADSGIKVFQSDYYNFKRITGYGIDKAHVVLVNFGNDTDKLRYSINIKSNLDIELITTIENIRLQDTFKNVGVQFPFSREEIVAKYFRNFLFEKEVAIYSDDLLTSAENEDDCDIQQYKVTTENPFLNLKYGQAFIDLKTDYNVILLGISKCSSNGSYKLIKNASDETTIEKDDYLLMLLNGKTEKLIEEYFGVSQGL